MRLVVLLVVASACATAGPLAPPVAPPPPPVAERPEAVPEPRVAAAALVPQGMHGRFIEDIYTWPGAAHFMTYSDGVVAIGDIATGHIRATVRLDAQDRVAVSSSDDGRAITLSNSRGRYVWSLDDGSFREEASAEVAPDEDADASYDIRGTERVLAHVGDDFVLRSGANGTEIARVTRVDPMRIVFAPDGRCVGIQEDEDVHVYDTERLRPVLVVPLREEATFAVQNGCAGLISAASDRIVLSHRVGGPVSGAPFATIPEAMAAVEYLLGVVDENRVIVSNGRARALLVEGRIDPAFFIAEEADRTRSIWSFGFLPSGGVYTAGRGFIDLFTSAGYASSACQGVYAVTPSGTSRTLVAMNDAYCDIERGDVLASSARPGERPTRFVLRAAPRGVTVLDLATFTTGATLRRRRDAMPVVALSSDGKTIAEVRAGRSARTERVIAGRPEATRVTFRAEPGSAFALVSIATGQDVGRITFGYVVTGSQLFETTFVAWNDTYFAVYRYDGTLLFERAVEQSRFTRFGPDDRYAVWSGADATEVLDLATGTLIGTVPGTLVVQEASVAARVTLLEHAGARSLLRVRAGAVETIPIGRGTVVGMSPDAARVALCDAGLLVVSGITTDGASVPFCDCIAIDRVVVHPREPVVLALRGTDLTLRSAERTLSFAVARRGDAPVWFVSADDGRFAAPEHALGRALQRVAGAITSAPLSPLDPARRTLDVLAPLSSLGL